MVWGTSMQLQGTRTGLGEGLLQLTLTHLKHCKITVFKLQSLLHQLCAMPLMVVKSSSQQSFIMIIKIMLSLPCSRPVRRVNCCQPLYLWVSSTTEQQAGNCLLELHSYCGCCCQTMFVCLECNVLEVEIHFYKRTIFFFCCTFGILRTLLFETMKDFKKKI